MIQCSVTELFELVKNVLSEKSFIEHSDIFDRRPLIEKANSLGGQRMKLLHWKVIEKLQENIISTDNKSVDAMEGIENFGAPEVEIFMVSHQWLRPSF